MKQRIVSRYDSSKVLFECDVPETVESGLAMRHALERAVIDGADLSDADLSDADLSGAYLSDADLSGADLRGADLSGADLRGAYLRGADLRGADLRGADLSGADLRGAYLRGADLSPIKSDFFDVLIRAPKEIAGLRSALFDGRVDGSTYEGECACLVGTIAKIQNTSYQELANGLKPDSNRPIERFFVAIRKGDTPTTNAAARIAVEWIDEFSALLESAVAIGQEMSK